MGDLHTHELHADAFYVREGELEVAVGERGETPSRDLFERFDLHVRR